MIILIGYCSLISSLHLEDSPPLHSPTTTKVFDDLTLSASAFSEKPTLQPTFIVTTETTSNSGSPETGPDDPNTPAVTNNSKEESSKNALSTTYLVIILALGSSFVLILIFLGYRHFIRIKKSEDHRLSIQRHEEMMKEADEDYDQQGDVTTMRSSRDGLSGEYSISSGSSEEESALAEFMKMTYLTARNRDEESLI